MNSGERPPISALIFDMDGLLVDSEPFAEAAMRSFLERYGHVLTDEVSVRLLGRRVPEAIQIVAEHYGMVDDHTELETLYNEIRLAAIRGNLRPLPGAVEIIAFGRDNGLRLALATSNTREHVNLSLAEAALADLFDAEATGEEVERGKPEPDIFLLAATRLGAAPGGCVVLEDSAAGIAAAKAAGMRAIWIPQPRSEVLERAPEPDVRLADLLQAITWLKDQGVGAASPVA
jgi:HAD superfamily hydrolase (TIGR01509 family)